jgi:RHS repeat-associated protein
MAVWWVSEPWVDLRLEDEPVGYQPARGRRVGFQLSYRQIGPVPEYTNIFGLGTNWSCSFRQYIYQEPSRPDIAYLHKGGAGWITYPVGAAEVRDGSILTTLGGGTNYQIEHIDGSVDTYSTVTTNSDGDLFCFITTAADPAGNINTYTYSTNSGIFRLDTVTDADGNPTRLHYDNSSFPTQITSVVDPYSRTNILSYDSDGFLTNSMDPAGLCSSFIYDSGTNRWVITNLITPYGTNGFRFGNLAGGGTNGPGNFVEVTLPTGGKHLYVYLDNCDFLSSWNPTLPDTIPLGNTFEQPGETSSYPLFNSFHWGPLQFSHLSPGAQQDPASLTLADYAIGRMRHWLFDGYGASTSLAIERAPSPSLDGSTEGQLTWYDYEGKPANNWTGTSDFPSFVAQVLPDGSTHFSYSQRGQHLNVTNEVSTYTALDGSRALRTNAFVYAANAIDLWLHAGPNGEQVVSNYFAPVNTIHQPDASYDALNQPTAYTYNSFGQLTSVKSPTGLTTTNLYFSGGPGLNRLSSSIDLEIHRTNSYTYSGGLVATHTDPRNLVTTSYWDPLQRLVGMSYPDGSTISNVYTALDVTAKKDRLGQWSHFGFNPIRQMVAATNENTVVTLYGYCDCGALMSQTKAWSTPVQQVITFAYDNQGNRWLTSYPDGYSVTNWFDSLQRVTTTSDGTTYRYFFYNNQGLVTNVSNSAGPEKQTVFDNEDRPEYVTDINGVTVTNTYDLLNRLQARTYPDGGGEEFVYSARGMVAYTNQLNLPSFYVYDEGSRKIFETNANTEVLRYTNSPAGDLLSLTDGKLQTTRWNFDIYGRVSNKLDQAGAQILRYYYDVNARLTNRWSAAKGNTRYLYDPVGNLTNIIYFTSPNVSFAYDALNRRTTMTDATGTTVFGYTAGDQLLAEAGPWASDTLTNTYVNRLRMEMALGQPTGSWTNGFDYDAGGRLYHVAMPAGTFTYTYPGGSASRLPVNLLLPNTSYINNTYDRVARLTGTFLNNSANSTMDSATYGYSLSGQRLTFTNALGTYVQYGYDNISQLKVGTSSVSSENRGYAYDQAWNLNWRTNNGSASAFQIDVKNQLTSAPNGSCTYDSNGNLLTSGGGRYQYSYDTENRLISWQDNGAGRFPIPHQTDFVYDGLGRLRIRDEYQQQSQQGPSGPGGGSTWSLVSETLYIYDGNRVIQERDMNNTPTVSYTRGIDLSGTMEGAGGIGGLLARSDGYSAGNWIDHNYYHADGNGNITYLVDSNQTLAAGYRYDPFGNTISSSGSFAAANVYRFSSKECHVNSGMYYYLYRFYDPNLQRWINRDPIGEPGFELLRRWQEIDMPERENEFGFSVNDPCDFADPNGLLVYLCARKGAGFPFSLGNHVYFWDDQQNKPCDQTSSSGGGTPGNRHDDKPPGSPGCDCKPIPHSQDSTVAKGLMDCCDQNANKGPWLPPFSDCHTKLDDCLSESGLTPPTHPRLGHPKVGPMSGPTTGPVFSQL